MLVRLFSKLVNFLLWVSLLLISLPLALNAFTRWSGFALLLGGTLFLSLCNFLLEKLDKQMVSRTDLLAKNNA